MTMIGVIGGTGLYGMQELEDVAERVVETPFGAPSSPIVTGTLQGVPVAFLARHGIGHVYTPTTVPYKANIWALKHLGVTTVVAVSAVGSLREEMAPGHVVVPDQIIDRTRGIRDSSFFTTSLVAHVGFADPYCPTTRGALVAACRALDLTVHDGGVNVTMEGPAFSTRAESNLYRSWGASIIGMTSLPEAKLAREAELCYATMALVTDYDCWYEGEEDVTVEMVLKTLATNGENSKRILMEVLPALAGVEHCACRSALEGTIMTKPELVDPALKEALEPIVGRHL